MFMVKGGAFNSVNKKIRKHEVIPSISADKICIKSCGEGMYAKNTSILKYVAVPVILVALPLHLKLIVSS